MSSTVSTKQQPVIIRLSDALDLALAYAAAIRDNAQDDQQPIDADLIAAVEADCNRILSALYEAHHPAG
jgi:hypothetical protein